MFLLSFDNLHVFLLLRFDKLLTKDFREKYAANIFLTFVQEITVAIISSIYEEPERYLN